MQPTNTARIAAPRHTVTADLGDVNVTRDRREVVAGLSFDDALARFVDAANDLRAAYYADRFPGMEFATLDVRMGKRYAAIWSGTCIYTFVDTLTGDILKAKTWKGPELKNPRGNVFDAGCISAVTAHGTASLR